MVDNILRDIVLVDQNHYFNFNVFKILLFIFVCVQAQFIAQSIGQAFQVAYMEFLKANGIEDHSFVKEMDYQEVLNSQEIFGDELQMFAKKELQKEVCYCYKLFVKLKFLTVFVLVFFLPRLWCQSLKVKFSVL